MQDSSKTGTRRRILFTLTVLGVFAALIALPQFFPSEAGSGNTQKGLIIRTTTQNPEIPNYDIRTAKEVNASDALLQFRNEAGKSASAIAEDRDSFVRGEELLTARIPHSKVEYNSDIRIPEVITPDVWRTNPNWLSSPSSAKRSDILRNFARENDLLMGVNAAQIDEL